ncbi:MAG: flagellar basal body-associated protein FliL [Methylocystis sp.]|nr:flagellar basal body-associated protein FliL [Methylocystis sp.]
MTRLLMIGLWVCIVTLASTYGGAYWKTPRLTATASGEHFEKLDIKKVKPITVPIISDGSLKGYVSAEFSYLMDASAKQPASLETESYFMDEAFRRIYADNSLDFHHIEKFDLNALTKEITQHVNERLGVPLLKETLVKNFTFVPKEDMPR